MLDRRMSPTEPACGEILRWPTARSRDWTIGFVDSARSNPDIIAVIAVGSAVRPRVPSTDIDLVVVCRDPNVLKETPPIEVDLRAYSAAEIDTRLKNGHDMLGWGVRFGRVLYQRDSFWDRVVNSCHQHLPLPSSKLARDRAAAAYRRLTNVVQLGDVDAAHEQALSYLTHLARAELVDRGIYPASRPELPEQLRAIGNVRLAEWLDRLLHVESAELSQIDELLKVAR